MFTKSEVLSKFVAVFKALVAFKLICNWYYFILPKVCKGHWAVKSIKDDLYKTGLTSSFFVGIQQDSCKVEGESMPDTSHWANEDHCSGAFETLQ